MILITGATGQLGGAVINQLLQLLPANEIAALVRDEQKSKGLKEKGIDIRIGNYDNMNSLDMAMLGINSVLLIAGTDEDNRVRQHQQIVDAAKKAGVKNIAYTSRTLKDRTTMANKLMEGHFKSEDYILGSGLNYIIFRNVLYMDTIPAFGGPNVLDIGINLPAGNGKVAFALRSEMGEAIANVLAEGSYDNDFYHLTGNESYSFGDVAEALSQLTNKEIKYFPADLDFFTAKMKERGVTEGQIERAIGFMTDIKNGQEDEISPDLENLLGRKPVNIREGLKLVFKI